MDDLSKHISSVTENGYSIGFVPNGDFFKMIVKGNRRSISMMLEFKVVHDKLLKHLIDDSIDAIEAGKE